jgi:hypothetical protein
VWWLVSLCEDILQSPSLLKYPVLSIDHSLVQRIKQKREKEFLPNNVYHPFIVFTDTKITKRQTTRKKYTIKDQVYIQKDEGGGGPSVSSGFLGFVSFLGSSPYLGGLIHLSIQTFLLFGK